MGESNWICVNLLRMMNTTNNEAFYEEVAHIFIEGGTSSYSTTLPAAVHKTSTTDESQADLATAVDWGSRVYMLIVHLARGYMS